MCSCKSGVFYKSSTVAVTGDNLVVTLDKNIVPQNLEPAFFVICQQNPTTNANIMPVVLSINNKTYPLLTKSGNAVMSDQIMTNRVYSSIFGNNPNHFLLVNNCWLKCTRYVATPTAPGVGG